MANKMLRSLTIDGVTYDAVEWIQTYYKDGSQTIANNTQTKIDMYTLPDDGRRYLCIGRATASYSANATGVRWLEQCQKLNGTYQGGSGTRMTGLNGFQTQMTIPLLYTYERSQGHQIALNLYQNSGSSLTVNWIVSLMVLRVGGVIRRLLNALKPLSFSLERGCA